jgi:tetratricopeptide (TPR) repeat protein
MTEYDKLDINAISYEWLDKTNDPKLLRKALRLLKEDGGYFPDLEKSIDTKLQTIDLKYKKHKEAENVTQADIDKVKEEMLKFEEEYNKKDQILIDNRDSKDKRNYEILKLERKQEANNEKIKGNELMKTKEYDEAIKHYSKSIRLDEFEPTTYANRALAYIKNTEYGKGLDDCNRAIDLKNDYIKAYYRRGICNMGVKKFREGMLDFLYVLNDNPSNSDILNKIEELNKKWKDFDKDGYEENCKRMKISLNRAKEGKYLGEGNITFKGEKGKEGFTKVQIIEDNVEDKKEKNESEEKVKEENKEEKTEEKKEEPKEEKKEEEEKKTTGFKKIQIIEED